MRADEMVLCLAGWRVMAAVEANVEDTSLMMVWNGSQMFNVWSVARDSCCNVDCINKAGAAQMSESELEGWCRTQLDTILQGEEP